MEKVNIGIFLALGVSSVQMEFSFLLYECETAMIFSNTKQKLKLEP